jgi:hypothetical protein
MTARRSNSVLISLGVLSGAVVGLWFLFTHNVHASLGYCVEVEFGQMPPNDDALVEWLKVQAGIIPRTVQVRRFGANGTELEISFIQQRTLAGDPPFPDLNQQCAALGYAQPKGNFVDCKNRYR